MVVIKNNNKLLKNIYTKNDECEFRWIFTEELKFSFLNLRIYQMKPICFGFNFQMYPWCKWPKNPLTLFNKIIVAGVIVTLSTTTKSQITDTTKFAFCICLVENRSSEVRAQLSEKGPTFGTQNQIRKPWSWVVFGLYYTWADTKVGLRTCEFTEVDRVKSLASNYVNIDVL